MQHADISSSDSQVVVVVKTAAAAWQCPLLCMEHAKQQIKSCRVLQSGSVDTLHLMHKAPHGSCRACALVAHAVGMQLVVADVGRPPVLGVQLRRLPQLCMQCLPQAQAGHAIVAHDGLQTWLVCLL